MNYDVIIIGAGAAGLMCAIEAGKRGRRTLVIEHSEKIGKKILISGGGRCNFTNLTAESNNFISENPHFCKSALARYTPQDFITLVEKHGIKYHEKKLGQLFCDGSAKEIVNLLLKECAEAGVEINVNCSVSEIIKNVKFTIKTDAGEYTSDSLVIATGGISIPQMGATDFGYKIAKQYRIKLIKTSPGLVPFVLKDNPFAQISGVSLEAKVSCNNISFRENILFTHRGLSGPAILQISSYWKRNNEVKLDLLPEKNILSVLTENRTSKVELVNFLSQFFPKRFSDIWCESFFRSKPINKLNERETQIISRRLHNLTIIPSGTVGFGKAEVTRGGINTDELSSKTMECKKVNGLYFIGEVVDVTGWLGGYNFQWAWSSGFAAGQYV